MSEENSYDLEAYIEITEDSPYKGGIFKFDIKIPTDYPFKPFKIMNKTKIFHPFIGDRGLYCDYHFKL